MRGIPSCLLAISLFAGAASAQQPAIGGRIPSSSQLPAYRARVERFTLAPDGAVDGLLLADGTEVETPPHLSDQMVDAIRPGDVVTVRGLKAASLPVVQAVTVEDERSGRTVVDRGLSAPPETVRPAPGVPAHREGRIRVLLHGPLGEVNGLLLDDGTTIRFDPIEVAQLPPAYRPGSFVVAEGEAHSSALGTVIRATALGVRPSSGARP